MATVALAETYEGTAAGRNGDITLAVTLNDDGVIEDIPPLLILVRGMVFPSWSDPAA